VLTDARAALRARQLNTTRWLPDELNGQEHCGAHA
jgi:hypothetical protein